MLPLIAKLERAKAMERLEEIMEVQQDISFELNQQKIGFEP